MGLRFLLADKELWESCANDTRNLYIPSTQGFKQITIRDVWIISAWNVIVCLCPRECHQRKSNTFLARLSGHMPVHRRQHPGIEPFDVDPSGSESLGCALLEIWGSCAEDYGANTSDTFQVLRSRGFQDDGSPIENFPTLKKLLKNHAVSLVMATTALTHSCAQLAGTPDRNITRIRDSSGFVASRHWYSTACWLANYEKKSQQNLCVLGLPGRYTTRGDWYLGVSAGSRSRYWQNGSLT